MRGPGLIDRRLLALAFACAVIAAARLNAQTAPALFISDMHFDPYTDPALVARLDGASADRWPTIFAAPASATQVEDVAALQKACPVRGSDTSEVLWQSTLAAVRAQAGAASTTPARFVVLSGDLLAHDMDCKYRTILPGRTHAQFLAFTEKTIRYVISSLRSTVSGVPIYVALGNNDTACGGNKLDPDNDFLGVAAKVIAEALPPAGRAAAMRDVAEGGYYSVPMAAPMRNTRIIAIDDLFFLTELRSCDGGAPTREEEARQLKWLEGQLATARQHKERVWVLGHVPPGITLFTTYAKRGNKNICANDAPSMTLDSERFAQILAANADIIHLAIFAHTHSDELELIRPDLGDHGSAPTQPPGIPVKVVPSVSPVNGNLPSFLVATVDPASANLLDYTMFEASNKTGVDATWAKKYTFTSAYSEPDFSGRSVAQLIDKFRADPAAKTAPSQAYLRNYFMSFDPAAYPMPEWPVNVCEMDHLTGRGFAACACATH